MRAHIVLIGTAATVAEKSGQRVVRTGHQRFTQDIQFRHGSSTIDVFLITHGLFSKWFIPINYGPFEILTNQNKEREMTAVLIQRRLKEIGVDVSIRVVEWATFISRFIKTGDFSAVVLGWGLGQEPDQFNIWHSSQQEPGQFNFIG